VQIPEDPFFLPQIFFACLSSTQEKDYAHGWRGGPTDERLDLGVGPAWQP
jgi:hypothetical protein